MLSLSKCKPPGAVPSADTTAPAVPAVHLSLQRGCVPCHRELPSASTPESGLTRVLPWPAECRGSKVCPGNLKPGIKTTGDGGGGSETWT